MAFAIMRAKKLSSMGSVAASLQHCYRDRETLNADQERTHQNEHLASQTTDEAMGVLRERLPEKRRKDAVLAVEYMMTASPEWWETASQEQQNMFFSNSVKWLSDKYGKDNIVTATVHRDELTPHLSAFVVPRTADGRLSAKEFIGNRTKMSLDQTTYAERMESLGLERGIKGSQATHQRVKSHYGALEQADRQTITVTPETLEPKVLQKGIFSKTVETQEMIAKRLSSAINEAARPMAEKASVSAQNERRRREMGDTLSMQQNRLQRLQEPFKGLSKSQVAEVLKVAVKLQQSNDQERTLKKSAQKARSGQGLGR